MRRPGRRTLAVLTLVALLAGVGWWQVRALVKPAGGSLLAVDFETLAQRLALAGSVSETLKLESVEGGHESATAASMRTLASSGYGVLRVPLALPRPAPKRVLISAWFRAPSDTVVQLEAQALGEYFHSGLLPSSAHDWAQARLSLAVPADARGLTVGLRIIGPGTVLVDDVRVEPDERALPAPPTGTLRGRVVDAAGRGVVARVNLQDPAMNRPSATTTSDAAGAFELSAQVGRYGLVAIAPGLTVGYREWVTLSERASDDVVLTVGAEGGVPIEGRVELPPEAVDDAWVGVGRVSDFATDVFVVRPTDGGFSLVLPPAQYSTVVAARGLFHPARVFDPADAGTLVLAVEGAVQSPAPPSPELVAALRASLSPLGLDAGAPVAELAPIVEWVGDAQVLGVGEATHGTHEFAVLRLRLLEALAAQGKVATLALEASAPETAALNDYVLGGPGSSAALLSQLHYFMWSTVEFQAAIEWLRAWNLAHPAQPISVHGVDMQHSAFAARELAGFLAKVDPADGLGLAALLAGCDDQWVPFSAAVTARAKDLGAHIAVFEAKLIVQRAEWSARTSVGEVEHAAIAAHTLGQYAALWSASTAGEFAAGRDRFFAQNLTALASRGRVVFWAHNGHVSRARGGAVGASYRALGFVFGEGDFLARVATPGNPLQPVTVGPPSPWLLEALLGAVHDGPAFFVATSPSAPVSALLSAPQRVRAAGAMVFDEANLELTLIPAEHFDGLIYVRRSSSMRPLP